MTALAAIGGKMPFVYDDGGRVAAGFRGHTGDCVTRAVAIAAELPYADVYAAMAAIHADTRRTRRTVKSAGRRTAREGIYTGRKAFRDYMAALGWTWTPTMHIGQGCTVHLVAGELPPGRLIVRVSRHVCAVLDGVIHDTYDPQRRMYWYENGRTVRVTERCVYGYWRK